MLAAFSDAIPSDFLPFVIPIVGLMGFMAAIGVVQNRPWYRNLPPDIKGRLWRPIPRWFPKYGCLAVWTFLIFKLADRFQLIPYSTVVWFVVVGALYAPILGFGALQLTFNFLKISHLLAHDPKPMVQTFCKWCLAGYAYFTVILIASAAAFAI